jgi:hypothetical protein
MAKYYTTKLTEAQYRHVLRAMYCYEQDLFNDAEFIGKDKTPELRLHERTEKALWNAEQKRHLRELCP